MYEDNKTHYKQNKYHCGPIIGKKKVIFLSSQEKKIDVEFTSIIFYP